MWFCTHCSSSNPVACGKERKTPSSPSSSRGAGTPSWLPIQEAYPRGRKGWPRATATASRVPSTPSDGGMLRVWSLAILSALLGISMSQYPPSMPSIVTVTSVGTPSRVARRPASTEYRTCAKCKPKAGISQRSYAPPTTIRPPATTTQQTSSPAQSEIS